MRLDGARVLAFGTAGSQGAALPAVLRGRGATAVRATTSPERAGRWAQAGEQAVVADLTDPGSALAAAEGADAVALHVPLSAGPGAGPRVAEAVAALRRTGLPVAVNLGTPVGPPGAPDPFGVRPVADALTGAGAAVVTPTAYLENLAAPWSLGPLARGELVYPRPPGDVLAWIASSDVAAAVVAALAEGVEGELLALAGPQALTFEQLAAELGAGLGRAVVFSRISAEEYGGLVRPVLGEQAAAGVAAAYGAMPEGPDPVMAPDAAPVWERLRVTPTPARTWASEQLAPLLA